MTKKREILKNMIRRTVLDYFYLNLSIITNSFPDFSYIKLSEDSTGHKIQYYAFHLSLLYFTHTSSKV